MTRPTLRIVHDPHIRAVPDDDALREQARTDHVALAARPIEEKVADMREAWKRGYASERDPQLMMNLLSERLGRMAYHVANMAVLSRESDREKERRAAIDEGCLLAGAVTEVTARLDEWPRRDGA